MPNSAMAPIRRLVAIGRSIKGWERFIADTLVTNTGLVSETRSGLHRNIWRRALMRRLSPAM